MENLYNRQFASQKAKVEYLWVNYHLVPSTQDRNSPSKIPMIENGLKTESQISNTMTKEYGTILS